MEEGAVRRGDVHLLSMSEFGGRLHKVRPVLIVQNDRGNREGYETIVAGIRHDRSRTLPVLVGVERGTGGLDRDSVIDAGHLLTVPVRALGRKLGAMPREVMARVDRALEVSLGLDR